MEERSHTQDLFVLFVRPDLIDEIRYDISALEPDYISEDEEDTNDTTTASVVLGTPIRTALALWKHAIFFVSGAVLATVLLPFIVLYRVYQLLQREDR